MKTNIRHIAFLVIPDATLLDITGPYEVFSQAVLHTNSMNDKSGFSYILHTVSSNSERLVKTASGFYVYCDDTINTIDYEIDTLFVPGVPNSFSIELDKNVINWIKVQSQSTRRICSVCTGTFFLAETGILNGKKATTHWEVCDKLAQQYPQVNVEKEPIFIKEGNIYTSAGISSGMDLALALIEEDRGRSFALEVAKQMVLYLKRQGNQSQFSSAISYQHVDYKPIQDIENWIMENLHKPLNVEILAEQANMSPRNFARVFVRETGITPAKYIDKLRIETACRLLVDTQLSLDEIAVQCGLKNADNMRRLFLRNIKINPSQYRINFQTAF